jgi:hypothetical protein
MYVTGECIVCQPSEFLKEAHGSSLALHRINVEVVQHVESKGGFGSTVSGRKELLLEQLHRSVRFGFSATHTPHNPMLKNSSTVSDNHYITEPSFIVNAKWRTTVRCFIPQNWDILPVIVSALVPWTHLPAVPNM